MYLSCMYVLQYVCLGARPWSMVQRGARLGEQLDPFCGDREGGRLALRIHELERIDAVGAVAPYLLPLLHMEARSGSGLGLG